MLAQAIFAGGCFWGIQAAFENLPGVISTQVGYIGGIVPNPTYMEVSSGRTGHAEAVEISYDPKLITYQKLLDVFFQSHDPTSLNRQGADIGHQYRSAVFYTSEKQKKETLDRINLLNSSGFYPSPVVTEIVAAGIFYPAEEYHQHYLQKRGAASCRSGALPCQ